MATHYTYSSELWLQGRPMLHMIKTKISNICTETICKPITDTSYGGINGGFYATNDYNNTPTGARSICVDTAEDGVQITVNGKTFYKNWSYNGSALSNSISRKTAVIYNSNGVKKMAYMYAKSKYDVDDVYPTYTQIIGGNDYNLDSWGSTAYYAPLERTVLAWDSTYAYLIVTEIGETIPDLKNKIGQLGLSATNSIILDGSGSTAMQCNEFTKKGGERHIFNMIRLINNY